MSFIEVFRFEADEEPAPEPPVEQRRPSWFGPAEEELGVTVPFGLIVGRSENGVVALPHATVYSNGIGFELVAQARGLNQRQANRLFHEQHSSVFEDDELPDAFLRVGFELPDGSRVSNLGQGRAWRRPDIEPDGPLLMSHGGGGGQGGQGYVSMRPGFWLWPLPEPGTLRLSCEWPVVDIHLCTVELDATMLRAAAARVTQLWPTAAR